MPETHINSKIVSIFRAGSFLSRAQGKEIDDFFSSSKKSVGSYWESQESKKVGSGLTFAEEELLLPLVTDVPKEDREFRKKVTEFYVSLETQVPYNTGRALEIGLESSNKEKLSSTNMPINLMDYIRYRHAKRHPWMATSKEEADGNSLKQFYIFDKSEVTKKNSAKADKKDAALQIYFDIKPDNEKVNMMLTLMGLDPREWTGAEANDLKLAELRKLAETRSEDFIDTFNKGDLMDRYWIKTMVNIGVLKNIGSKYLDGETNKILGNSLEELLLFFTDELNSDAVLMLKSRAQESLKKPIKGRK